MSDFDPLKQEPAGPMGEVPPGYEYAKAPDSISQDAAAPTGGDGLSLDTIMRIPVTVKIVLGSASMPVAALMKLGRGALIPLDRKIGEPVDVVVNGRVVARGEVVVMDDDPSRFGISLTEVVGPSETDKLP
jgi:flagellar motor switch protein FliN/FliY